MGEIPGERKDFLIESIELIEELDKDLIDLENDPTNLELLNSIFRVAHTIKGAASFLHFDTLTHLTLTPQVLCKTITLLSYVPIHHQ